MNDDELRRSYQAGMREVPASEAPVTEEELLMLVERRGDEATRLAILDRVMASETTRREFELLRTAASAAKAVRPAPAPARPRWVVPLLAAAAVALVAVALTLARREPEPQFRGPTNGEMVALTAPWDGAEVGGSAGLRFAWHPVRGTRRYRVEVVDPAQNVVFETEVADSEAVTEQALPAGDYLWRVEAQLRDGSLRHSPVRRLRVTE